LKDDQIICVITPWKPNDYPPPQLRST
jgi:hypothetical protein